MSKLKPCQPSGFVNYEVWEKPNITHHITRTDLNFEEVGPVLAVHLAFSRKRTSTRVYRGLNTKGAGSSDAHPVQLFLEDWRHFCPKKSRCASEIRKSTLKITLLSNCLFCNDCILALFPGSRSKVKYPLSPCTDVHLLVTSNRTCTDEASFKDVNFTQGILEKLAINVEQVDGFFGIRKNQLEMFLDPRDVQHYEKPSETIHQCTAPSQDIRDPEVAEWEGNTVKPYSVEAQRILGRLESFEEVTSFEIDKLGRVVAYCSPTNFHSLKRRFDDMLKDLGIMLSLIGEEPEFESQADVRHTSVLSATSQRDNTPVDGICALGLPVLVKSVRTDDEHPALLNCYHCVANLLKDLWTQSQREQPPDATWKPATPNNVNLEGDWWFIACYGPNNNSRKLGKRAIGWLGEKADVSLIYLHSREEFPFTPSQIEVMPLQEVCTELKVCKKGPISGETLGKVHCLDASGPVYEKKISGMVGIRCFDGSHEFTRKGDSGSPVFILHNHKWKLLGIAVSRKHETHRPKHGPVKQTFTSMIVPFNHLAQYLEDKCDVKVSVADVVHECFPSVFTL